MLVTILLVACTHNLPTASHSPSPSRTPGKVAWSDCGGGFQCGTLQVPLDYSNPDRQISLALMRKRATDQSRRIGSLLLNPGGPGESGIDFLRGALTVLAGLNHRFDLVAWDPRGIGASTPVTCVDGPQLDAYLALDSVLDDPEEKQAFIQGVKDFVAGCENRSGNLLPFLDSASTARDMDQIRQAVGDAKLTYLGFSYGSYIGQWYAHLFPSHVRAMALDAVLDSTASDGTLLQIAGFEQNLQAFFTDCRSRASCLYGRSGDPEVRLKAAMARLDATPLAVGSRQLTRSLAMRGVLITLYNQSTWPYLDQALTALDNGDGSVLLELADFIDQRNADGTYSNLVNGGNAATACIDSSSDAEISAYDALGPAYAKASPLFGPLVQYGGLECAFWPVKAKNVDEPLTVKGAPPILLVGGTNDPATPYSEAQSVTHQIEGSVLLTRQGNGHTSYDSSTCAHAWEDSYLIDLVLPPSGTVCTS